MNEFSVGLVSVPEHSNLSCISGYTGDISKEFLSSIIQNVNDIECINTESVVKIVQIIDELNCVIDQIEKVKSLLINLKDGENNVKWLSMTASLRILIHQYLCLSQYILVLFTTLCKKDVRGDMFLASCFNDFIRKQYRCFTSYYMNNCAKFVYDKSYINILPLKESLDVEAFSLLTPIIEHLISDNVRLDNFYYDDISYLRLVNLRLQLHNGRKLEINTLASDDLVNYVYDKMLYIKSNMLDNVMLKIAKNKVVLENTNLYDSIRIIMKQILTDNIDEDKGISVIINKND